MALQHDVTSVDNWQRVYGEMGARFDRLDVLVNNTGIMLASLFESTPIKDLRRQQRVNVESVFLGMQGALPLMRRGIAHHGAAPSIRQAEARQPLGRICTPEEVANVVVFLASPRASYASGAVLSVDGAATSMVV